MNDCHNSGQHKAHYDLSTYEGIMRGITANHPLRSELYNSVTGIGASMPIGGKLSTKEISYIKIWIRMGAPNSTNCSACDTTAYTFSKRIQPLITSWCIGCHNQGSPGGGYDLSTYTGIKASIVAGRLLGTFRHDVGFSPMPQNSSKLSDCDVNAVVKWVNTGYPNN